MYGRGVNSIAEQIKGTPEEAQEIIDNFYKSFPTVKVWMDETLKNAYKTGYVEDLWGKRRRLTDLHLDRYEIKSLNNSEDIIFNPILCCEDRQDDKTKNLIESYKKRLEKIKYRKEYEKLLEEANRNGLEIKDNGGFISQAERQCVNARIQGSAASMTKLAMIKLDNDKELKDLGFKLLIGVHDELIGECPFENLDKVAELLTNDMKTACPTFSVPFKCDADASFNWYFNDYKSVVLEEFLEYASSHDNNYKEAFNYISSKHIELTRENLKDVVEGYDIN